MCNQETGDDKKNVDADKSTLESRDAGVERNNRNDRDSAQAVNINKPARPRGGSGNIAITGAARRRSREGRF